MWLKVCLLLAYILVLFTLSRLLEALAWCEMGFSGCLSRQLLDPMLLSVSKLKALLEQRGVSYEGVLEKSELTGLVDASGQVSAEEMEASQYSLVEETSSGETNFTSGAHFIEQVEDAKDSVWLVQVITSTGQYRVLSDSRWKSIQNKAAKFGVRTGLLDCSLDERYCYQKGWRSPFLLLALPSQFEKKASVAMYNYSGSVKANAVFRWLHDKLDEKVLKIDKPATFLQRWKNFSGRSLDPEIRMILFTKSTSSPLLYSALSVKFPGRVKFGLVSLKSSQSEHTLWKHILKQEKITRLPAYMVYSSEKAYLFGAKPGEQYSFISMERFLKCLHPCLNDIFIISFCIANLLSWLELFISNCSVFQSICKFLWCVFSYNLIVIMLWLPVIGIFQMPYLDQAPLLALKLGRLFCTSDFGGILRADYTFYSNHLNFVCLTFVFYLILVTIICRRFREREIANNDWFNFSQMGTLTHLQPNALLFPLRLSRFEITGLDSFVSYLAQPSLWLAPSISSEYINYLPTWVYHPPTASLPNSQNDDDQGRRAIEKSPGIKNQLELPSLCCSHSSSGSPCDLRSQNLSPCHEAEINTSWDNRQLEQEARSEICYSPTTCSCPLLSVDDEASSSTDSMHLDSGSTQDGTTSTKSLLTKELSCSDTSVDNKTKDGAVGSCSSGGGKLKENPQKNIAHDFKGSFNNLPAATGLPCSSQMQPVDADTQPKDEMAGKKAHEHMAATGFPPGYIECHQCVICLDDYVMGSVLCGLPCGHVFHESCIISWLNMEKHFCPMCRWPSYKLQLPPNQS